MLMLHPCEENLWQAFLSHPLADAQSARAHAKLMAALLSLELEPACVVVCPTEAIYVGDLNDPSSRVAKTATTSSARPATTRPARATAS